MESHSDPLRKIPTKHAPEAKADIGSSLKAARVKKGASLEAVSQHTRISKRFLDALENNRFEEFPALAYLRGFLKGYCDYLEVDFDALWKQVVETPAAAQPAEGQAPAPAAAPSPKTPTPAPKAGPAAPAAAAPAPKPAAKPAPAAHKPEPAAHKPAPASHAPAAHGQPAGGHAAAPASASGAVAGILIALSAAAILGGIFFITPKKAPAPPPPVEAPPAAQTPAALQPLKPATEPQLTLVFRRDMWVSVSVDGVEKFQGRVPQGAKQEWKGKRALTLRASDPQALKLTLNGSPYTLPAPDAAGNFRIEAP
jgi:cytoskeletal protein RodZ